MIGGLSASEAGLTAPGEIVDLYIYRRRYDDEQHQLQRKAAEACAD